MDSTRNRDGRAATAFIALSRNHWIIFLATLWAFAYIEELFWSRGVWHERDVAVRGDNWDMDRMEDVARSAARGSAVDTLYT